jgi:hypothetical protein
VKSKGMPLGILHSQQGSFIDVVLLSQMLHASLSWRVHSGPELGSRGSPSLGPVQEEYRQMKRHVSLAADIYMGCRTSVRIAR